MNKIENLHSEAMALVDRALVAKLRGETERAELLLRDAYKIESEAASLVASEVGFEPTRSVLHRSAASLALECGETREAERLISIALSGDPPNEIASELRDLLEAVYFQRHLDVRGITLEPGEFQFSLAGQAVGFGIANSAQFIERVKNIETIVYRTAERLLDQPFRERGRRKRKLEEELELYVSIPRAASFAVSFKIGRGIQLRLPGMELAENIIDELFECIELFDSAKTELLSKKIQDSAYYRNFVGLARKIAPDGEQIRTVGFTAFREDAPRYASLRTPRKETPSPEPIALAIEPHKSVQVRGSLRFADARKDKEGQIQLIDEEGMAHKVRVPEGMMSDIVKPMWESEVIVSGSLISGVIDLEDIEEVEE